MKRKIRKIGNGYRGLFSKQLLKEMHISEGPVVQVEKIAGVYQMKPLDEEFSRQVELFLPTEWLQRNTYRELAK